MGFPNKDSFVYTSERERVFVPLEPFVYARHGREFMGLKSPVSVPCNVVKRNKITSRWHGRYREVESEGSLSAKI